MHHQLINKPLKHTFHKNTKIAYSDTGKGTAIVLLHGFLDELESLAMGDSDPGDDTIKDEDRLLILTEPNIVFDKARGVLPARAAES